MSMKQQIDAVFLSEFAPFAVPTNSPVERRLGLALHFHLFLSAVLSIRPPRTSLSYNFHSFNFKYSTMRPFCDSIQVGDGLVNNFFALGNTKRLIQRNVDTNSAHEWVQVFFSQKAHSGLNLIFYPG